jgi:Sigma-70 region 2
MGDAMRSFPSGREQTRQIAHPSARDRGINHLEERSLVRGIERSRLPAEANHQGNRGEEVRVASLLEAHGQAGDEGNFEVLYRTYKTEVQRLASYLLRNAGDAEDASQTVFLNVLRALRQGVRPADPRAWLLAITRNVCFSRRRAAARRPDEVELDPEAVGTSGDGGGPSADDIVGASRACCRTSGRR